METEKSETEKTEAEKTEAEQEKKPIIDQMTDLAAQAARGLGRDGRQNGCKES